MPVVLINALPGLRPDAKKRMKDRSTTKATAQNSQPNPTESKMDRPRLLSRAMTLKLWSLAACAAVILVATAGMSGHAQGEAQYPPLSEYLMPRDAEIALARSAAPPNVSARATIKLLTESGYQVASDGDNGFVCLVMRGWAAPTYTPAQFRDLVYDATVRAPICFDPAASRTVLPYYELRSTLGMAGQDPDQIAARVEAAYAKGELPRRDGVTFAYMWSADQNLGTGIGQWHPHMMVFAPYYENSMIGGNEFGSPLPQVSDDAGTPFTVVVIPVDHRLAVKAFVASDQTGGMTATAANPTCDALAD